jgi:hypothetical protein
MGVRHMNVGGSKETKSLNGGVREYNIYIYMCIYIYIYIYIYMRNIFMKSIHYVQ